MCFCLILFSPCISRDFGEFELRKLAFEQLLNTATTLTANYERIKEKIIQVFTIF